MMKEMVPRTIPQGMCDGSQQVEAGQVVAQRLGPFELMAPLDEAMIRLTGRIGHKGGAGGNLVPMCFSAPLENRLFC